MNDNFIKLANKSSIILCSIIALLSTLTVITSFKPESIVYIAIFITWLAIAYCLYRYKKDFKDKFIKYILLIDFMFTYFVTTNSSDNVIVFIFAFPLMAIFSIYGDKKITIVVTLVVILTNAIDSFNSKIDGRTLRKLKNFQSNLKSPLKKLILL